MYLFFFKVNFQYYSHRIKKLRLFFYQKNFIPYCIILLFSFNSIFAQNYDLRFKFLTVKEGLSQSWVRCIYQDSYGFMWFGTGGNGLDKFDGYNFTIYKNNPRIRASLSNNSITSIFEDHNQNLWIGTQIGLNLYDREKTTFCGHS